MANVFLYRKKCQIVQKIPSFSKEVCVGKLKYSLWQKEDHYLNEEIHNFLFSRQSPYSCIAKKIKPISTENEIQKCLSCITYHGQKSKTKILLMLKAYCVTCM